MKNNYLIWITGISGVGKTTFAKKIYNQLKKSNDKIIILDGDKMREMLFKSEKFSHYSKKNRLQLAKIYSNFCKLLYDQGFTVIIATISLFKEIHSLNRKKFKNYCEIYIKRSNANLIKQKLKTNLNNKKNIVGYDINIDEPLKPHFLLEDIKKSELNNYAKKIIKFICK
tara:strand:- start:418 stop:927 length:510 start_codon:yes stop_codon:yes gene_type:complete